MRSPFYVLLPAEHRRWCPLMQPPRPLESRARRVTAETACGGKVFRCFRAKGLESNVCSFDERAVCEKLGFIIEECRRNRRRNAVLRRDGSTTRPPQAS